VTLRPTTVDGAAQESVDLDIVNEHGESLLLIKDEVFPALTSS
jgi:hypothetical protein